MSIENVRTELDQERAVLVEWQSRLDSVAPENQMSDRYKTGWGTYLDKVVETNDRLIALCDAAIADPAQTQSLRDELAREIAGFTAVRATAAAEGLDLLADMLQEEVDIREEIRLQI